jgi:hypothetical protein
MRLYTYIYIYVLGTDMLLQPASFPGVAKALRACAESKDEVLQTKVLQVCAAAAGSQFRSRLKWYFTGTKVRILTQKLWAAATESEVLACTSGPALSVRNFLALLVQKYA